MKMRSHIVLNNDDIFQALREYISNHVDGVSANDVCSFDIRYNADDTTKSFITVALGEREIK